MPNLMTHIKRKVFGQHFLVDQKVIQTIIKRVENLVEEFQPTRLLEIGPGKGALTKKLIDSFSGSSVEEFIVVEKDDVFFSEWQEQSEGISFLRAIHGDFLDCPVSDWKKGKTIVVSNLPYSVATPILIRLCQEHADLPAMVLMFQKEVAQRVNAATSTKDFGSLTLHVQNEWDTSRVATVSPKAFRPPPKVLSQVIELRKRIEPRITGSRERSKEWEELTRLAFQHRRKMIRNNFSSRPQLLEALEKASIPLTQRAEQLTWEEWERFFQGC